MKIAIPIWEDKVSPVLDTASRLLIVELEDKKEASRFETYLAEQDLSRRCFRIQGLGIDILICGAISRPFSRMLGASGINIIPGISGHPEDVLNAYLRGKLFDSKFLLPGIDRNTFRQNDKPLASQKTCRKTDKRKGRGGGRGRKPSKKTLKKGGSTNNGKQYQ